MEVQRFSWASIFLVVVCATFLVSVLGISMSASDEHLSVLVYHHMEEAPSSDVSCAPAQFSAQMATLLSNGYTPLRLRDAERYLAGGLANVKKPFLITFDDGYESVYKYAFAVVKKLSVPITIFVVTSRIGRRPQFAEYLSESQISEMAHSGLVEFGSHTDDLHTDLMRIWNSFMPAEPSPLAKALKADLIRSKERLTALTGSAPIALAWPYGKFNDETKSIAAEVGFCLHFTSRAGYNKPGSDHFQIKRIPVTTRDTPRSVLRKVSGGWL